LRKDSSPLEDEFVALIQAHQALINKLVFLYADQTEDRKDLRQEILLQAWRSFAHFRGEASFSTWLYRVGLNTALTLLKQRTDRQRKPFAQAAEVKAADPGFEADDKLGSILRQLNPIDRTLLVMNIEGYSAEEICQTLGLTAANMRIRLHRARKKAEQLWTL
jgi:RNA polymerase sigma-70 factor (ECF subfamily)